MKKSIYILSLLLILGVFHIFSVELIIGSGAGYKKPVSELIAKYTELFPSTTINSVFGNMEMIISQSGNTDKISCVIGDKKFLVKDSITISNEIKLGKGILVLAWGKKTAIKNYKDIAKKSISKIGIPNRKSAIYGLAGDEFLNNSGLQSVTEKKSWNFRLFLKLCRIYCQRVKVLPTFFSSLSYFYRLYFPRWL